MEDKDKQYTEEEKQLFLDLKIIQATTTDNEEMVKFYDTLKKVKKKKEETK